MMNTLDNFTADVPQQFRSDIFTLAELCADFINNMRDSIGDDAKPEPVEYLDRSGFWSSNNGGFSVSQSFNCGNSSGIYHTQKEREFIDTLQENCAKDYCQEHGLDLETFEWQSDDFADYEQSYFDDQYTIIEAEIFVCSDTGKVQVSLLAHYKDAPYHRAKYAEEIYCQRFDAAEFNPAAIFEQIKLAYEGA